MKYVVKGLGPGGVVERFTVQAADEGSARRAAAARGLDVLQVRPSNPLLLWLAPRPAPFALDLFCQELLALMDAGLSVLECIDALAEKQEQRAGADALTTLRGHLEHGQSLAAGMEQLPGVFPPLFVATVRAAEKSSNIREAVARYLDYHRQVDRVKRKLVAASVYPLVLLAAGLLVSAFLMLYVVPKFSRIYEEIGGELPWLTRMLVKWGSLFESQAPLLLGGLVLAAAAVGAAVSSGAAQRWLTPRLWRLPALGARLRLYELARLYRNLAMLQASGLPLPIALDMTAGLLSPHLRDALQRATLEIRQGQPASRAFRAHGLTTPVSLRLLAVGERSGRMSEAFAHVAGFHEEELSRWVDWFTRLIEPVLMVLIGALIGLVVVLLYLPIFELAESIR
jgi:general secretion pathway protein F